MQHDNGLDSSPLLHSDPDPIAARLAAVRERIDRAAVRAGRAAGDVRLLCVTKTVDVARVIEAARAGATAFGENYVQEARAKAPVVAEAAMGGRTLPEWHLIGRLQSNKVKYCPGLFSVVQTIDSVKLAEELAGSALKKSEPAPRVLVEVNLAGDPGRPGVDEGGALALCEAVAGIPGLTLEGLMGIAPSAAAGDPEDARPHFRRLRALWDRLPEANRRTLSMGMSGDFEVAIEEGATLVRIGTAIFGRRTAA